MTAVPVRSRFFDLWSRVYDIVAVQRIAYQPVHDVVLDEIHAATPSRVLDVGCGTGLLTTRLHQHHRGDVVGLDFSSGMLRQASRRAGAVPWVRGDSMHLPFDNDSFDAITCTESFHWYRDQPAALAEFHRVLPTDGLALIALMNPPTSAFSRLSALGPGIGQRANWPTPPEMRDLLAYAGFEVVEQRPIRRLPGATLFSAMLNIARAR